MTAPSLILLIDDDEQYTRVLKRRFEQHTNLQVQCFTRASEALQFSANVPVSGILLDMMMQEETGLDFVEPLQARFSPVHLIVMTGYASIATTVTAMKRGATDYVAKPIAFKALLAKLALSNESNTETQTPVPAPLTTAQIEWEHIQRVLADNHGNISRTAEALGMHRRSLQRKLQKHSPLKQQSHLMRLLIKTRTLHKWLMRGIGIQVLIWALTGLYMVSMDIHFIHGETLSDDKHNQFSIQDASYPIAALLDAFPTATQVTLYKRQDKLVYRFKRANDTNWTIVDATNGQPLTPLTSSEARQIATSSVTDSANITAVKLIDLPEATPAELSPRWLPVWQVTFDDLAGTTFYIQQATGQIVTRRHNVWRAFDWMWRLHIMDYDDGENVANPLLLVLAVLAIVAIISGILLLACRFLSVSPPGSNTLNALNKGGHND